MHVARLHARQRSFARIALSGTYPLVNDVAAEVIEMLDRLTTVEARLSAAEEGKLG